MAKAGLPTAGMFGNLSELKQRILFVLGAMLVLSLSDVIYLVSVNNLDLLCFSFNPGKA